MFSYWGIKSSTAHTMRTRALHAVLKLTNIIEKNTQTHAIVAAKSLCMIFLWIWSRLKVSLIIQFRENVRNILPFVEVTSRGV